LDGQHIASSNSDGTLTVFNRSTLESFSIALETNGSIQMKLDCLNGRIISCNDLGFIHLVNSNNTKEVSSFKAHQSECWTVKFIDSNEETFLSGADDGSFKGWDSRIGYVNSLFANTFHEYGVCCINCNPFNTNQFITGSYDNSFAIWDIRNLHLPSTATLPLCHEKVGGGAWRAEWHPTNQNIILLSCMYAGNSIFNTESGDSVQFDSPNNSISYGGIFLNPTQIATCSFYNKKVSLWNIEI